MMHKQLVGIWLWPELLLVSSFIITPAIAQHLPGNNNSIIVHCYESVVSEVATASSSFSAVVTPTSTVFFDTAFNDACYALAAISSETSSSPASKLVRPTAGPIPGARSSPRPYDEKQAFKNDYRPLDNTTQVPLELQDNHGFKFTSSGTEWIGRLPVDVTARLPGLEGSGLFDGTFFSAADAGSLRCQPRVQRLVSFSTGSLWGYSVDCGLSRLPLNGELDDHSNCSEAQIQHAQDVARAAGLERAWELAGIQDCQRVAGERQKERVERREKKRRGKKFLRNTLAFLVKQHKFDTAFIHSTVIRAYNPSLYLQINFPVFLLWIAAGKGLDAALKVLYQLVSSLPVNNFRDLYRMHRDIIPGDGDLRTPGGLDGVLDVEKGSSVSSFPFDEMYAVTSYAPPTIIPNTMPKSNDVGKPSRIRISLTISIKLLLSTNCAKWASWFTKCVRELLLPPQGLLVPETATFPLMTQSQFGQLRLKRLFKLTSQTQSRQSLEAPELPQSDTNTSDGTNEEAGCPNASATTEEAPTESSSSKVSINIAERVATSTTSNADDANELELTGDENDAAPSDLEAPERILDSVAQSSVTVESYPFADEDISPATSVTEQSSPLSAAVSVDVISEAAEENKASSVSNFNVDEEEQADDGDDTSETSEEDVSSMIVISAVEAADAERHSNSSLFVSVDLEQDAASWSPAEKPSSDDPVSAGCHSDEKNEVTMSDLSTKEAGVEEPHVEDTSSSDMSPEQIEEDVASTIDISAMENEATIEDSTATDDKEAGVEEPHVEDTSSSDMSPAQIEGDVASTIDRSAIEEETTVEDSTDRADTSNDTGEDMSSGVGIVEGADVQQEDAQQKDAQVQEPIQEPTSSHITPEETVAELTSTSSPEVEAVLGLSISTGVASNTTEQLEVHPPGGFTSLSPAPIDAVFSDIVSEESVEVVRERPFRSKLFNADITPFNQAMEGDWDVTMSAASTTSDSTAENEAEATSTSSSSAVNEPRSGEPHRNDPSVTVHQSSPALTLETPASTVASAVRSVAWPLPSSGFTGFGIPPPSALGPTRPVISSSGLAFSFGGAGWSGLRDLATAAPQSHTSASPPPRSAFAKRPKSERDAPVSTGPGSQTSASAFGTNSVFKPLTSAAPTADPASASAAQTSAPSSTPVKQEDVTEPQPQSSTPPVDTLATDAPTVNREATQRTARPAKSLLASAMAKIKPVEKVFAPQVTNTSSDISVSQSTFATSPREQVSPPAQQDSARLHPSVRQNNTDNRVAPRSDVLHQSNNSAIPSIHQRSTEAEIDDAMQKIVLQMSGKVLTNPFAGPTQPPEVPAFSTSARRPDLARPPRAKPSTTSSTAPTEQEIRDREVMREYREFLDAEPAVANRANEVHRALAAAASSPVGTARNARRPVQAPAQPEPTVVVYGRDPYATQPVEPVVNVAEDQSPKGESNARRGMYRGNRAGGKVQKRNQNRMAKMAAGENGGDCTAGAGMNR
ncbi:hypothetical protein QFC21_004589 [Naganishia friedmannii]|uniref:Uncharacterized protein n=1 Tax=Naganishia friedmannii TaxID=89922 RepID=A0ACC2VFT3_9TREE|nr:hypothetical protein QFC21_004589 [Naganishia friedmannii]